jgi:GntR family transcriptional regulator, transcriptional repressor for pyruvate dehydrogenase complex
MKTALKPIRPKRVSDQVFEQLRELIYRGELKPGDKVMPERELSLALGVSRTTVRHAINKLVVLGLLAHQQGQGTFVRAPEARERSSLALADLLEVRMGLECNAAALAAHRATGEQIDVLRESLEKMETAFREKGHNIDPAVDAAFHMAIAHATKNPVHIHLMKHFHDLLFMGIKENLRMLYEDPRNIDAVVEQHRAIFQAIQRRDPDMASSAMRIHIRFVMLFFRDHHRKAFLEKVRAPAAV